MLMEADLPDDVDALRVIVLEQAHKLANVDAEIERLRVCRAVTKPATGTPALC